ncbi:MAG: hypothetical protein DME03_09715 [Candidatus Rokuibacteriota bacterium]|nr:MAG: hypothetical protein DME03_09715 [Candidatus Rokubacteria bacterium]
MTASALPILPTTVVGSYAIPAWLWAAYEKIGAGGFGAMDVAETENDAVATAVRDQERAGVDLISDGEMRRQGFIVSLFKYFHGLRPLEPRRAARPRGRRRPQPSDRRRLPELHHGAEADGRALRSLLRGRHGRAAVLAHLFRDPGRVRLRRALLPAAVPGNLRLERRPARVRVRQSRDGRERAVARIRLPEGAGRRRPRPQELLRRERRAGGAADPPGSRERAGGAALGQPGLRARAAPAPPRVRQAPGARGRHAPGPRDPLAPCASTSPRSRPSGSGTRTRRPCRAPISTACTSRSSRP